jgi:hypothetical protein
MLIDNFYSYLLNEGFIHNTVNVFDIITHFYYKLFNNNDITQTITISFLNDSEFDIIYNCCQNIYKNNKKYTHYSYKTSSFQKNNNHTITPFKFYTIDVDTLNIIHDISFVDDIFHHQNIIDDMEKYVYQHVLNNIYFGNHKRKLEDLDDIDDIDNIYESKRKLLI